MAAFSMSENLAIKTFRWEAAPDSPSRPCGVYLLHGMGEHAARYDSLAQHLSAQGWRVGAHDHPGHGQSSGKRGVANPPDILVNQAQQQLEQFASECGAQPVLFGHSLGGVVAAELVLVRRAAVCGLMLSAPAIVPIISSGNKLKLRVLGALAPNFAVELPYDASLLTHDQQVIAEAQSDPLIHGFKSAGLVRWLLNSSTKAITLADQMSVPTLLMIAGSDQLIDIGRTEEFSERIPEHLLSRRFYEGCHHEILNEVPAIRNQALADITAWLDVLEA